MAIFSLEMSSQQLVQRLLCSNARVNLGNIRNGLIVRPRFSRTSPTAASRLAESQMYIDDTAGLSILELRAKARRFKQKYNIQLIVIDYLQLLRSTSRRAQDNRQLEIAEISSGIKALAKELNIPIIVLAQLNRNPEARKNGRPVLSDLRESGSIEQDADMVGTARALGVLRRGRRTAQGRCRGRGGTHHRQAAQRPGRRREVDVPETGSRGSRIARTCPGEIERVAMNDLPYTDIREATDIHTAKLLIQSGWMILEIYRRKRQIYRSDPMEFEEYPVYILGNMEGG